MHVNDDFGSRLPEKQFSPHPPSHESYGGTNLGPLPGGLSLPTSFQRSYHWAFRMPVRTASKTPVLFPTPRASLIPAQGQRPGLIGQKTFTSAEGAIHRGMSQAVGLGQKQISRAPRALPRPGMIPAVGRQILEVPSLHD